MQLAGDSQSTSQGAPQPRDAPNRVPRPSTPPSPCPQGGLWVTGLPAPPSPAPPPFPALRRGSGPCRGLLCVGAAAELHGLHRAPAPAVRGAQGAHASLPSPRSSALAHRMLLRVRAAARPACAAPLPHAQELLPAGRRVSDPRARPRPRHSLRAGAAAAAPVLCGPVDSLAPPRAAHGGRGGRPLALRGGRGWQ